MRARVAGRCQIVLQYRAPAHRRGPSRARTERLSPCRSSAIFITIADSLCRPTKSADVENGDRHARETSNFQGIPSTDVEPAPLFNTSLAADSPGYSRWQTRGVGRRTRLGRPHAERRAYLPHALPEIAFSERRRIQAARVKDGGSKTWMCFKAAGSPLVYQQGAFIDDDSIADSRFLPGHPANVTSKPKWPSAIFVVTGRSSIAIMSRSLIVFAKEARSSPMSTRRCVFVVATSSSRGFAALLTMAGSKLFL